MGFGTHPHRLDLNDDGFGSEGVALPAQVSGLIVKGMTLALVGKLGCDIQHVPHAVRCQVFLNGPLR
jgi:hypothetical protein